MALQRKDHRAREYPVSHVHFRLLCTLSRAYQQRHGHVVSVPCSCTSVTQLFTSGSTGSIQSLLRGDKLPAHVCCMGFSSGSKQGPSDPLPAFEAGAGWSPVEDPPQQGFVSGCHHTGVSRKEGGWWPGLACPLVTTSSASSWCPRQVDLHEYFPLNTHQDEFLLS